MAQPLRYVVFDAYQRYFPAERMGAPVKVVLIDENAIGRIGQWPWPRTHELGNRGPRRAPGPARGDGAGGRRARAWCRDFPRRAGRAFASRAAQRPGRSAAWQVPPADAARWPRVAAIFAAHVRVFAF